MSRATSLSSKQGNLRGLIRLCRPLNLAIAASTLLLLKYGWIVRWKPSGSVGLLPIAPLIEGILVVVFLMMSGNWINAYFDVQEDRINRPDRALVDRTVKRRALIVAHQIANTAGLLLALHLSWNLKSLQPVLLASLVSLMLWRYSTTWKSIPLLGNVVVASLLGLVPLWLAILETPFTEAQHHQGLWMGMTAYGGLAMCTGLVRELAKDAMDVTGDREAGKETFAVQKGTKTLRALCLSLLMVLAISYSMGIRLTTLEEANVVLWAAPLPFWAWSVFILIRPKPNWRALSTSTLFTLLAGTLQCLWIPV